MNNSGVLGSVPLADFVLEVCENTIVPPPVPPVVCDEGVLKCNDTCFTTRYIQGGKNDTIKTGKRLGAILPSITACRQPTIVQKYCKNDRDGKYCGNQPYG